jgi:trehalose 6-phosphate synthase/phosphatase
MGLNFRILKLNSNFQHLSKNELLDAYRNSDKRLIFFDYEGTLQVCEDQEDINTQGLAPTPRLVKLLNALSSDPRNKIWIVSGRSRDMLGELFASKLI